MSQQRAVHDNLVLKMRVAKANRHVEWSSENSNGRFDDSVLRRTGTIHPRWQLVDHPRSAFIATNTSIPELGARTHALHERIYVAQAQERFRERENPRCLRSTTPDFKIIDDFTR